MCIAYPTSTYSYSEEYEDIEELQYEIVYNNLNCRSEPTTIYGDNIDRVYIIGERFKTQQQFFPNLKNKWFLTDDGCWIYALAGNLKQVNEENYNLDYTNNKKSYLFEAVVFFAIIFIIVSLISSNKEVKKLKKGLSELQPEPQLSFFEQVKRKVILSLATSIILYILGLILGFK